MRKSSYIETFIIRPFWCSVDILLPPRCIGTGEIVSRQGMVSPEFWQKLDFISAPFCAACGMPFEYEEAAGDDSLCASCIQSPPRFDAARAALVYNDASRGLLLKLKYGDQLHTAVTFANWLRNIDPDLWNRIDYIVPVPLHWQRLWQRRFNQSALIAKALSAQTGKPILHALKRRRYTGPQKGLNRRNRLKNVRMAFQAVPAANLKNLNIVLIDDVMTSGATVNECAKVLKKAGADTVTVLTVARVLKQTEYFPELENLVFEEAEY